MTDLICPRCDGNLPRSTSTDLMGLVITTEERKKRVAQWLGQTRDHFKAISYWATWYESKSGDFWYLFEHGGEMDPPRKGEDGTPWVDGHDVCRVGMKGSRWHLLDEEALIRSYHVGEILRGVVWTESADSNFYDVILQLAILGEDRYG